ncbi:hypothetical protein [Streptomyces sp. NBC_00620]|nr:hypothetical protein [Streptomyces sp. NBC_00620]MCX4977975.1 hypothetical protein [Streptomyces sp. NBC_00620]WTB36607.1 hypothetical protein OG569_00775 [Streptomyces sp. NBC_00827]WUC15764.1 hypothetical protein OG256_40605 [Streptomyces sp. NBC_00564]WUC47823.1 hypothetical protein OG266_04980 [Streptomyces sp. NBC_00554]
MPLPQLTVHRHDRRNRAPITMAGEIDLELPDGFRADWARWPG